MRACTNCCDIKSCYLCSRCLPDWLPAVALHKTNYEVRKGQRLFNEDDAVKGIFFVYSGTIKVHKRWDKEKELITRFARSGDIVGYLGLGKDPVYPVSATALERSMLCYLHMDFFDSTLRVNPDLTYQLMHFFANELQCSQKTMRNLAHMSVKARIAQSLIALKNQFGMRDDGSLTIELSRQDLASFSAVSYETLFKVMNDFIKNDLVRTDGRKIYIVSEASLLEIIDQDNH
jgi:CRP-like cAMP-binding protein